MKFADIPMSRRTRQNHALEHATFTIMARMDPSLNAVARSNPDGFVIYGEVNMDVLQEAVIEALSRLKGGEAELAIHPNCGTNLAVGVSLITLGTMLGMASNRTRTRVTTAAASSVAGWMAARPVGEYVQKHFTTSPDLKGVRVIDIARRNFMGFSFVEVRTVQE